VEMTPSERNVHRAQVVRERLEAAERERPKPGKSS